MTPLTDTGWQTDGSIPVHAGIGLRSVHQDEIIERQPSVKWFEAHTENYFAAGGAQLEALQAIRQDYPLSLHGVGLSIGSTDPLDEKHLKATKRLLDRFEPGLVSEHLCWGSIDGQHLNDLLPLPRSAGSLRHVVEQISRCQEILGQRILIENVSSYLEFTNDEMSEWEFLANVADGADCGILLDVNNIYVNAINHEFDAIEYVDRMPGTRVAEIHLAGHRVNHFEEHEILIDTHDDFVAAEVWRLYEYTIERIGPRPTLIEWDTNIPSLNTLIEEAGKAELTLAAHS